MCRYAVCVEQMMDVGWMFMDVLWICYGCVMGVLWMCDEWVMEV